MKRLLNVPSLGIAAMIFCAVTPANPVEAATRDANPDSIRYIDDRKLSTELLVHNVADMISENPAWGITNFRNGYDSLVLEKKVSIQLPAAVGEYMPAEEMYEMRAPGVLMVGRYYDCGNCPMMHTAITATAAVLTEDGICVTNDHVMEGLLGGRSTGDVDSVAFVGTIDGKVYPILEILSYSKVGDIAIFKVDTRGDKLTPIPLGNSLRPGTPVRAITHPSGNLYYYSDGVVARNTINSVRGNMSKRMEITADYAVGSSGGPIFDQSGNLVGLVSTTASLEAGGSGRGGNNARRQHQMTVKHTVPVELIKSLIE